MKLQGAFEPKNLFRNVYFWLAIGGAIFLLYVGFIALTFLPRSTSEVTNQNSDKTSDVERDRNEKNKPAATPKKEVSSKRTGKLAGVRISLVTAGGWFDSDDYKMTIVIRAENLKKEITDEIRRSGGIEIEIDGVTAAIVNSEPYGSGFLTRAEAVLSAEKFEKFKNGETQRVEIKTVLRYQNDTKTEFINRRFAKRNKTEVEGIKIDWK